MMRSSVESKRIETPEGWIIVIHYAPWSDEVSLYIGKKSNGKRYTGAIDKEGIMILTELIEGAREVPTLRLSYETWLGLSEAFTKVADNIDKKEVDAELKATKYHLEDMRKLTFKTK